MAWGGGTNESMSQRSGKNSSEYKAASKICGKYQLCKPFLGGNIYDKKLS